MSTEPYVCGRCGRNYKRFGDMMVCGCSTPKRMAVQLPAATVEALQRLAKQRGCTISDVLRESICKESEVEGK